MQMKAGTVSFSLYSNMVIIKTIVYKGNTAKIYFPGHDLMKK